MSDETVIKVEGVSKDFILPHEQSNSVKGLFTSMAKGRNGGAEIQHALSDISFDIKKGEFFGIVGRNGGGKSTLLKILAGIYQPTKGQVITRGKLVPFIELGVGFNPELSGRENVYLNGAIFGFSRKEIDAMYDDIVAFAELEKFMDQKLKNYSSGMQVRLAFSMAIRAQADILLIDEVLAVGDAEFQRKCFDYFQKLKGSDTTVIFVSHNMNDVREYCTRALLIDKSQIVDIGDTDSIAKQYSQLFVASAKNAASDSGQRWGNQQVMYEKVAVEHDVLSDKKELVLNSRLVAKSDIKTVLAGFTIKNAARQNLVGTNSLIAGQRIGPLKKGQTVDLTWCVPNIFSDGQYKIDITASQADGEEHDWWEDAVTFTVARETEHAPYTVSPPITLNLKTNGK